MPSTSPQDTFRVGEWLVQPALDTISRGSEVHKLEPRMMRLLVFLANSAGSVVSIERLLEEVWSGVIVGSASVYQAVSQLRKLLGDVDAQPIYIVTVPRKGYRLVAAVVRPAGAEETPVAAPSTDVTPVAAKRPSGALRVAAAVLAAIAAAGFVLWNKASAPATENSIVVLPFVDLTADKADQSFCDGLTEELSNWLSQIPTLRVVARTSAFAFRGRDEDVREIGKALDTTSWPDTSISS